MAGKKQEKDFENFHHFILTGNSVGPGQECWSSTSGVHGCDAGTMCGPWNPDGELWDGVSPWYCLFQPKHTEGEICNYDLKVNKKNVCVYVDFKFTQEK